MVRVVFVHPDLGIGGAERLVVDAALALKRKGHLVSFITAHHDPTHCFPETMDGTFDVLCAGDWIPRSTCGCFYALWAYLRMIYISLYLIFCSNLQFDVLFVDLISACIPILRLKRNAKIIFYCHYPDQLLTTRKSVLKSFYRFFLDKIEEYTTRMADVILVNSEFTADVFKKTFKSISVTPRVLYPCFDTVKFDASLANLSKFDASKITFLSINRYERKKNVALAIQAFQLLLNDTNDDDEKKLQLVVAGGYDPRVKENIEYHSELESLAEYWNTSDSIKFLKSPSDDAKFSLLNEASCLIYTPSNEHFGIVPVEAMYMGTPVLAVNSGGPIETVIDGTTGFLREPTAEAFAEVMKNFVDGSVSKTAMSEACRNHVVNKFSFNKFASHLHYIVQGLVDGRKQR